MKRQAYLFILALLILPAAKGQTISFYRENVVMQLDSAHCYVVADLYFRNNSAKPASQTVYFPYSCHSRVVKVDTISIVDNSNGSNIRISKKIIAGVIFELPFAASEQKKIKVTYAQDHNGQSAGYVLTKVKYYYAPLSQANYTLFINDPNIKFDSATYKPDNITTEEGRQKYSWHKSNFNPRNELCIYFHTITP